MLAHHIQLKSRCDLLYFLILEAYIIFQKGDFNETLSALISALGGNKTNPLCSTPGIDYKGININTSLKVVASNNE